MRIAQSSFSGAFARIIVQYGTKEQIVVFGPFAPPMPHEPKVSDPLTVIEIENAISEIATQTGQPEEDARRAIDRHLSSR